MVLNLLLIQTSLVFDCGICGIVGPNGCGKSNIADAFRWVMGEQSAKSVRGDRMSDVIFSGTDTRKPLKYAEVAVSFTGVNNALLKDHDKVTIKRRLYRSGDSDYFINGVSVRLKDIQSLLWDSGNAFAHIGQGKIDNLITLKPYERRYIFEEAAGISRFKQRRLEVQRKLDKVVDNIARIKDIHQEVKCQKDHLEEQAKLAQQYKERKKRLEFLEKSHFTNKMGRF